MIKWHENGQSKFIGLIILLNRQWVKVVTIYQKEKMSEIISFLFPIFLYIIDSKHAYGCFDGERKQYTIDTRDNEGALLSVSVNALVYRLPYIQNHNPAKNTVTIATGIGKAVVPRLRQDIELFHLVSTLLSLRNFVTMYLCFSAT